MTRMCYNCEKRGHEESECPYCPFCHHWYGNEKECYVLECWKERLGIKKISNSSIKKNPYKGLSFIQKKQILYDENEESYNRILALIAC